jgi:hypothetical protein
MIEINKLIEQVGKSILKSIPENQNHWEYINFKQKILITYSESQSIFFIDNLQKTFSVSFRDELGKRFFPDVTWQLREAMYDLAPDKGAWYSMDLTILPSGNFNIQFEYEIKPEFSIPLEDSDFIKDYQKFPRSKNYIPEWLRVILERNQIS